MELTTTQKLALPVIEWLIDTGYDSASARATGRTTVLAYAFITHAIKSGGWIRIWDHTDYFRNNKYVLQSIERLLRECPEFQGFKLEFRVNEQAIRISLLQMVSKETSQAKEE